METIGSGDIESDAVRSRHVREDALKAKHLANAESGSDAINADLLDGSSAADFNRAKATNEFRIVPAGTTDTRSAGSLEAGYECPANPTSEDGQFVVTNPTPQSQAWLYTIDGANTTFLDITGAGAATAKSPAVRTGDALEYQYVFQQSRVGRIWITSRHVSTTCQYTLVTLEPFD